MYFRLLLRNHVDDDVVPLVQRRGAVGWYHHGRVVLVDDYGPLSRYGVEVRPGQDRGLHPAVVGPEIGIAALAERCSAAGRGSFGPGQVCFPTGCGPEVNDFDGFAGGLVSVGPLMLVVEN